MVEFSGRAKYKERKDQVFMRYDTPIYFCTKKRTYDKKTGNYTTEVVDETIRSEIMQANLGDHASG